MLRSIAVFVAACFATAAAAGDGTTKPVEPPTPPVVKAAVVSTFETLDKNGDQRISRTEAGMDKSLSNIFATADTDGDGYVSKPEYIARPQG
jgi:hypothetical protein